MGLVGGGVMVGLAVGASVGLGDLPGTVGMGSGGTAVVKDSSHSTWGGPFIYDVWDLFDPLPFLIVNLRPCNLPLLKFVWGNFPSPSCDNVIYEWFPA